MLDGRQNSYLTDEKNRAFIFSASQRPGGHRPDRVLKSQTSPQAGQPVF
ncbi:hypothetical protein AtDm6_2395 [Acetobacter tropicalis]|jgi:hypothetical protein|uniref:Uncharacterized protein n=1 Tax=Acetobacter tropicalis TaxID=104102 RepID=A0A094YP43_9PROT|nr:hypothetical protein AtDm6_2395 [Acetobacter tropicalis]